MTTDTDTALTSWLANAHYGDERAELLAYGRELADAGLRVWLSPFGRAGYLSYLDPENGCYGTFQRSEFEGWGHSMPIQPSTTNGSSMYVDTLAEPWTVDAARECAQPVNRNDVVGSQSNYRKNWLSGDAIELSPAT
jgi:hypothetical protein